MTAVLSDYHGHTSRLTDAEQAAKAFDEQAQEIMPTGTSGQTIWVGTETDRKMLRVDLRELDGVAGGTRFAPPRRHSSGA